MRQIITKGCNYLQPFVISSTRCKQFAKACLALSMEFPGVMPAQTNNNVFGAANVISVFGVAVKNVSEETHCGSFFLYVSKTKSGNYISVISCFSL